jgi:hypothetical protein
MGSRHRFADVEALKRYIGEAEGDTLEAAFAPFETRSRPRLLAATRHGFTLITRSPRRPCARSSRLAFPSCVAVYPRDPQSRRVLCR